MLKQNICVRLVIGFLIGYITGLSEGQRSGSFLAETFWHIMQQLSRLQTRVLLR